MHKIKIGEVFASHGTDIGDEGVALFMGAGMLLIRGLLTASELEELREQTSELIHRASSEKHIDTQFKLHKSTGDTVPFRIEYIVEKSVAAQKLLAHPYIMSSMQRLMGSNILPTWDSIVFKNPGKGAVIPWHRDQRMGKVSDNPIAVNADFYLDESSLENCLWAVPGSHYWTDQDADNFVSKRANVSFALDGADPLPVKPGDVLLHNVFTLHGSPESELSTQRRVIYFEYRSIESEMKWGPHTREYCLLKQQVLDYCKHAREKTKRPAQQINLRVTHEHYWRKESDFLGGHL